MTCLFVVSMLALPGSKLMGEAIPIASFSTITTELANEIGKERVQVSGLVRPGVDPHEYEPRPVDLEKVGAARLILASGKNMESYVAKLRQAALNNAELLPVGDFVPSLKVNSGEAGEDPHWWHSIADMRRAAVVVRDELTKLDPSGKEEFAGNARQYLAKLDGLDRWAKTEIAKLPRDQRKLVTSHDAFQYFARDYGFTIYPIEGVSTEEEPSSKKISDLIAIIKQQGVKAVFFENAQNPKVIAEITKQTGAAVGGELYADGLGIGDAATYDGMFRHNVTTIVEALK